MYLDAVKNTMPNVPVFMSLLLCYRNNYHEISWCGYESTLDNTHYFLLQRQIYLLQCQDLLSISTHQSCMLLLLSASFMPPRDFRQTFFTRQSLRAGAPYLHSVCTSHDCERFRYEARRSVFEYWFCIVWGQHTTYLTIRKKPRNTLNSFSLIVIQNRPADAPGPIFFQLCVLRASKSKYATRVI